MNTTRDFLSNSRGDKIMDLAPEGSAENASPLQVAMNQVGDKAVARFGIAKLQAGALLK